MKTIDNNTEVNQNDQDQSKIILLEDKVVKTLQTITYYFW